MSLKSTDQIFESAQNQRHNILEKLKFASQLDYPLPSDPHCGFQLTRPDFKHQAFKCEMCQNLGRITHLYKYQPGTPFELEAGKLKGKKFQIEKVTDVTPIFELASCKDKSWILTDPFTLTVLSNWILQDYFTRQESDSDDDQETLTEGQRSTADVWNPIQSIDMAALCSNSGLMLMETVNYHITDEYCEDLITQIIYFINTTQNLELWFRNPKVGFLEQETTLNGTKFPVTLKIFPGSSSIDVEDLHLTTDASYLRSLSITPMRLYSSSAGKSDSSSAGKSDPSLEGSDSSLEGEPDQYVYFSGHRDDAEIPGFRYMHNLYQLVYELENCDWGKWNWLKRKLWRNQPASRDPNGLKLLTVIEL